MYGVTLLIVSPSSVQRSHERPQMALEVEGAVLPIAVGLVDGFVDDLGALTSGPAEVGVHLVDHDRHAGGDGAERAWRCHAPLRRLWVQPDDTIACLQLGVNDSTVGIARQLARAQPEHPHEVLERGLEVGVDEYRDAPLHTG